MKKITIEIVLLLMLLIAGLSVKAEELPVLSLDSAIARAKGYSIELIQIRRQQELNGAKLTEAASGDSYKTYQKQYLERAYNEKEEEVQQLTIAYEISRLFDEILLNEEKLNNQEKKLNSEKTTLNNIKLKYEKGLISKTKYMESILAYESIENSVNQLKTTIASQYQSLCGKIGVTPSKQYKLQKEPVVYEPFEIAYNNVEGYLSAKAEQNLYVWKAIENAKINDEIDYESLEKSGNSYTAYLEQRESIAKAQDTSETTKQQFESNLRSKYTELLQLQEKYLLQLKELQQIEMQLVAKAKLYELGRISKSEYDKLKLSYDEGKTALQEIVIKQEYTKQVIQKPYLL